ARRGPPPLPIDGGHGAGRGVRVSEVGREFRIEAALVALDTEQVVAAVVDDALRPRRLRVQGSGGDDTAPQGQLRQQSRACATGISLVWSSTRTCTSVSCVWCVETESRWGGGVRRGAGAAHGLAVEGQGLPLTHGARGPHPSRERRLH